MAVIVVCDPMSTTSTSFDSPPSSALLNGHLRASARPSASAAGTVATRLQPPMALASASVAVMRASAAATSSAVAPLAVHAGSATVRGAPAGAPDVVRTLPSRAPRRLTELTVRGSAPTAHCIVREPSSPAAWVHWMWRMLAAASLASVACGTSASLPTSVAVPLALADKPITAASPSCLPSAVKATSDAVVWPPS